MATPARAALARTLLSDAKAVAMAPDIVNLAVLHKHYWTDDQNGIKMPEKFRVWLAHHVGNFIWQIDPTQDNNYTFATGLPANTDFRQMIEADAAGAIEIPIPVAGDPLLIALVHATNRAIGEACGRSLYTVTIPQTPSGPNYAQVVTDFIVLCNASGYGAVHNGDRYTVSW